MSNKGGGLLVYVPTHLPVKRRADLEINRIEAIWLELKHPRSKPCLLGLIYRPPSTDSSFYDDFDLMLTQVDCKNCKTYLLGDFNIDLIVNNSQSKRFLDLTKIYNLKQIINEPTRPVSGTLIDHIFANCNNNILKSGTLPVTLSDHLPIFVTITSRSIRLKIKGHLRFTLYATPNALSIVTLSIRISKTLNISGASFKV